MLLKFRFVGNAIPALALAFGFSLFALNTPAWASDIKNLERKIEYLKQKKVLDAQLQDIQGKLQALEKKYQDIAGQSSASEGTKASKPAASTIAVGTKLNGAQIKSLFSGKSIRRADDSGQCDPFRIDFEKSGSVKVSCTTNSDYGKWFIKDDTVGLEMDFWWNGEARYYTITKGEGDLVIATAHSGSFRSGAGQKWPWKVFSP